MCDSGNITTSPSNDHNFLAIGLPTDLKCHFYLILDSYEKRASKSVFSSIPLTISETFKKKKIVVIYFELFGVFIDHLYFIHRELPM